MARAQYAIVGIGETGYSRKAEFTTRALAAHAVMRAAQDAGLPVSAIDGMLTHGMNDTCGCQQVAGDVGARLDFHMDCVAGGAAAEALAGLAIGAIEAGYAKKLPSHPDNVKNQLSIDLDWYIKNEEKAAAAYQNMLTE